MAMAVNVATKMMVVVLVVFSTLPSLMEASGRVDIQKLRKLAAQNNVTCILVFGDSSVDPGNNNRLSTTFKGNFAPYGKSFYGGRPTGRFCNGRLTTDFIAEALGFTKIIPGYLQPNVTNNDILHGVSFASAASGYDDLTANLTNVLPVSKQLEYLLHYKIRLTKLVGQKKASEIIGNAIFILSMGTNDFIQNYFIEPTRAKEFTIDKYEDFLDIKQMHRIGATRLVVVGVPPLGCMPLVKTLLGGPSGACVENFNNASFSFNTKVQAAIATVKKSLGLKTAYVDTYAILQGAMNNPKKYGFTETSKGCCGTGEIEFGDTCKGLTTCKDPAKYIYWDAVHPTEKMYSVIADDALQSVSSKILY
ncbi:hypothetical protein MKW94_025276 [Papaver nudicaule]|uniref:GDSL esterase/lipase n=1 Tax=Papaver nudicaule TaxID=74823 RepID=A0AA41V298_PAPNU|nr:hypothetical protein [Papaver nudicaule]